MLCNFLNATEQKAFMALAYKVALADHRVPMPESLFVDELKRELGNDIVAVPDEVYGPSDFEPFKSSISRLIVMLNLYCLAFSDDEFHINEAQVLKEVGRSLGFSEREIGQFSEWGENQSALMCEVEMMIDATRPGT